MVCGHSLTEDEGYQHVLTCHPPSGFHGSQLVRIDEESETKSSASKEPLSDQLQCICQVCGHCIDVSECDTHMTTCIAPKRFNQQRFIMLSSKSETEKKRPSSPPPVPVVLPTTPSSPKRPSSPPPPALHLLEDVLHLLHLLLLLLLIDVHLHHLLQFQSFLLLHHIEHPKHPQRQKSL